MQNSKTVKAHFDLLSPKYKENFSERKSGKSYGFRTRLELVKDLLDKASGSILDCACGTGEITAVALLTGEFKIGVIADISENMLDTARILISGIKSDTDINYCNVDIFKYKPEKDLKFDVILCLGLIAHTGALGDLLLHLKSMLTPGGKIILQSSLAEHWGVGLGRILGKKRYKQLHGYEINYYEISDIKREVELSGLIISDVKRYCFGFPYGDRLLGKGNYWLELFFKNFSSKNGSEAIFEIVLPS